MNRQPPPRPHLLIAEPDDAIRRLLVDLLNQEGYLTHVASSVAEALALVDEQVFQLVLTDLFVTPAQPRFSAVQDLHERCYPTPVGILTGWMVSAAEAERLNGAFVLQKPFELEQLLTSIAACLHPPLSPRRQQQAQVIPRFFAMLNARAWDRLPDLCTPDLVFYPPTTLAAGAPQKLIGLDAYLAQAARSLPRFPDFHFEDVTVFGCPQALAARATACWTAPNGRPQRQMGGVVFHFVGERIGQIGIRLQEERLRQHLAQQATPPPDQGGA